MNDIQYRLNNMLERISTHFRLGNRSADGVNCLYQDDKGHRCAIGMFIPEELMTEHVKKFDGAIRELFISFPEIAECSVFKGLPIGELSVLQRFHDRELYWNEEGLSQEGELKRSDIIQRIKELTI